MVKFFSEKSFSSIRIQPIEYLPSNWKVDWSHIHHIILNISYPKCRLIVNLLQDIRFFSGNACLVWLLNHEDLIIFEHMIDHLLKPISLMLSHRPCSWFLHILHHLLEIIKLWFRVCLCDQKWCSVQNTFLNFVILSKGINEIFNSCLEFLARTLKVHFLKGQDKFQFWSLRESSVMEVAIGENPMETIAIAISRLIQHSNSLEFPIFISELCLKNIRYFSLWLRSDSHRSCHILLSGRTIYQVPIRKLGLQGRVGQDVTWWCFSHFGKAKDGHCLVKKLK